MTARKSNLARKSAEGEIVLERVFDAPRDLVFRTFTEADRLVHWWGPKGFTTPACKVDLHVGGVFHYCMRSPEGHDYWGKGIYRDIVPGGRLVYADLFSDEAGRTVSPTVHGLSPDWPAETEVTVAFEERGGGTKVTLRHEIPSAPPSEIDMCRQGWTEMMERLDDYLKSVR